VNKTIWTQVKQHDLDPWAENVLQQYEKDVSGQAPLHPFQTSFHVNVMLVPKL
jgi:hypothetical protein